MSQMIPVQPYVPWAAVISVLHVVAISATMFRLVYRYRIRRLWWDDFVVAVAVPLDVMYFVVLWVRYRLGTPAYSVQTRANMYWLSALLFFFVLWISRISMALSLTRLVPSDSKSRHFTNGLAVLFFLCFTAIIIQLAVICGGDQSWRNTPNVQCRGTSWVSSLTLDVIGDVCLMLAPLVVLWRVPVTRGQRRLVHAVFAAGLLITCSSIVLHVFLLGSSHFGPNAGRIVAFMSHIEATIALFVSNLLVLVALFYRKFREEGSPADEGDKTLQPGMTQTYATSTLAKHETNTSSDHEKDSKQEA